MLDVIVIGAGPVGSFLAKELAADNYSVLVLEEHDVIGKPVHCTGVIGAKSFQKYNLPEVSVQNKIPYMRFISPFNQDVTLHDPHHWAYIVGRTEFDQSIANWAQSLGAQYQLNQKVVSLSEQDDCVEVETAQGEKLRARYCVMATGSSCNLPYKLGFYRPWYFLKSAQIQTKVHFESKNTVDVYLGTKVSGGQFIWIVPISAQEARIGVFSRYNANQYLKQFLERPDIKERIPEEYTISRSVIPIGGLDEKSVRYARIMTVGDAAGQVKPTSAGGITFGIMCARILKNCLAEDMAMKGRDLKIAKDYYRKVRRKLGIEMVLGDFFRTLFTKLEDKDWNQIIELANDPYLLKMIHEKSEFDRHSKIIKWALTNKDYRKIFFKSSKEELFPAIKRGATVWI